MFERHCTALLAGGVLVDTDQAAVALQIAGNRERCRHLLFFLETLR
jgi:hypothetical protein